MFTGLIQAIGTVHNSSRRLLVKGCFPFSPLELGESVAVDGVCLTVVDLVGDSFLADVSEETLSRTTLGDKADKNLFVNLEPALRLSDRLGGHLVSGHVDGIGEIKAIQKLKPLLTTIHISGGDEMMRSCINNRNYTKVLGVSILTSMDSVQIKKYYIMH